MVEDEEEKKDIKTKKKEKLVECMNWQDKQ